MTTPTRPPRPVHTATVARTETVAADMVRVILTGEGLRALPELTFTDHYVKLKFGDVTRTYTIRWFDRDANELALDFVIHGDEGLAGPWAAHAQPGDEISFMGPGGEVGSFGRRRRPPPGGRRGGHPRDRRSARGVARPMPGRRCFWRWHRPLITSRCACLRAPTVTWVHRDEHGLPYGEALVRAVIAAGVPDGVVEAFVHGNADMIKPLRRYLFREVGLDRSRVSISGYWRTGLNEDGWQSSKSEFNAAMEAEDGA